MNRPAIRALVAKDLTLFSRDKFFGIMTIFSIILYISFYYIMPRTVDETIEIAVFIPQASFLSEGAVEEEDVSITSMSSEEELKQAILDKKFQVGIYIPPINPLTMTQGKKPELIIYYPSDLGSEMKEMFTIFISEWINIVSGRQINIEENEIILGPDMAGAQISFRDRLLPMFAFMLLIMETFTLANLITSEIEHGTVRALLSTPMKINDLFLGKGIVGILLAFSQTVLFLFVTGSLTRQVPLVLTTLFLGSVMFTSLAFFIASISKDTMSVVGRATIIIMVLIIPCFSSLFPGPVSGWIRVIPSYHIVNILSKALNFNAGWSGNIHNLLFLSGFNIVFLVLGVFSLRRRLA